MLFSTKYKKYIHQPLVYWKPQIRLLKIKPDLYGPIRCEVEIFDLDTAPAFAALSYTWGPENPVYDVVVDGRTLPVRKNLHHFLKCRRKEKNKHYFSEKDLYLFIDQICIDQSDPEERNRQVQLMSQIYSKCWHVILWLNDEEGQCLREARHFGHVSKRTLSLAKLLSNDYFTRLWIVQELLLARSVCVFTPANTWLQWCDIVDTTLNAMSSSSMTAEESAAWRLVPRNTSRLILMRDVFSRERRTSLKRLIKPKKSSWLRLAVKAGEGMKTQELLEVLRFSANICHEPRDKVYGLMSLLEVEHQLTVDYNKSIYEVYKDAIMGLYRVVELEDEESYKRWIKATQQLGKDMGVDDSDIAELFALLEFANLILPTRGHLTDGEARLPSLVSMVGVVVSNTLGTDVDSTSKRFGADGLTHHKEFATNQHTGDINKSGLNEPTVRSYLGLPPGLRRSKGPEKKEVRKPKTNQPEVVVNFQYNIVQELSHYSEQGESEDPISQEKRWNAFTKQITDVVQLHDKGLQLSWYFLHNGVIFRYRTTPNWEAILRLSPSRMASIVKEYEDERATDEEPATPEAQPVRVVQHASEEEKEQHVALVVAMQIFKLLLFVYLGVTGFKLVKAMVRWCFADEVRQVVSVVSALWGFYRVARRKEPGSSKGY
ncbi:heterokaryon incompatibility protein-domain-containing protein [Boeremia exigua]|uniref:heterokaryon incompatibility protein-domain-containing protein n=1 Tax=Boeremia exigua TaxID=749465 RepID=UPI001E8D6FD2|nr:heterokaryon incompatibility protein-domain-containing protein [Boeremia exigua]KAH6642534.1 heterokaryon incompatibility protein-domain-containing protein [Boeremia exigua]